MNPRMSTDIGSAKRLGQYRYVGAGHRQASVIAVLSMPCRPRLPSTSRTWTRTSFKDQLRDNIGELPDATGCDAAFLALFRSDLSSIEPVIATSSVFSACNAEALTGESLSNWPWLCKHLGHLKIIEIKTRRPGPAAAREEFGRLAELGIGSALIIGFSIRNEVAGYLALANEHPLANPMPIFIC